MRYRSGLAAAFLGPVSLASAQRLGFTHGMLPARGDDTTAMALGDVDGDGDLDALVGNRDEPNRLYVNSGAGVFEDATAGSLPALIDDTRAVALGDVDGDGDLDALVGNDGQARLYRNDGMGVFTDATAGNLPALIDDTRAVALGDVDGDGDLDAFLGNTGAFPVGAQDRLYLNDGTGAFADETATNLPVVLDLTNAVALGDVDGDGDLDALVGNNAPDRLYLNGGTGVFTDATVTHLPVTLGVTTAVALGDVDGDGDLDAFFGGNMLPPPGRNRLYLNGGTGVFTDATATNLPALLRDTHALSLGDVDGDGDLDAFLATVNGPAGRNRLLLNGGTGIFADAPATSLPALLEGPAAVALGDVDGDGDLDALLGIRESGGRGQERLYLNGGTGLFTDVTAPDLPATSYDARALALGDVDGDGDLDAVLGGPGQNRLHLNGGTGMFTDVTATNLPALLESTTAVALGDVDGDGDLDAFVGNEGSAEQNNRLHLNGGTGVFTDVTATNLPVLLDASNAVALGDVDGDGDLDAFLGNASAFPVGAQDRLYLNGGTGVFTDATGTHLPTLTGITMAVALGDVDGDGDLDAFAGNYQQQSRLFLNDGSGVLADATATSLPAVLDDTWAVALGDLDGDGDLDVFVGNSGSNRLYLNGGTGVFADATATHLPPVLDLATGVALGDVDGDGDLDAFVGNGAGGAALLGQSRLYLNDGAAVFADATATSLPAVLDDTWAVALGDLDGDGDLDALVGNGWTRSRLYRNLARQLSWRGAPRVGKPLGLDVHGPSWGAWFLGFSRGTADIEVLPFGTLRLDPGDFIQVFASLLDGGGRASIAFPVPADPVLVGASGYWQALVAGPSTLTNLEVTTLTDL